MNRQLTMLEKTRLAWNGAPPEWVEELALLANKEGLNGCARRLKYSGAVISQTLGNKYGGDLDRLEATVRGALMQETVHCPVLGDIGRDICLQHQKAKRAYTNSVRTRLYKACRSGCPHSRLKGGDDA